MQIDKFNKLIELTTEKVISFQSVFIPTKYQYRYEIRIDMKLDYDPDLININVHNPKASLIRTLEKWPRRILEKSDFFDTAEEFYKFANQINNLKTTIERLEKPMSIIKDVDDADCVFNYGGVMTIYLNDIDKVIELVEKYNDMIEKIDLHISSMIPKTLIQNRNIRFKKNLFREKFRYSVNFDQYEKNFSEYIKQVTKTLSSYNESEYLFQKPKTPEMELTTFTRKKLNPLVLYFNDPEINAFLKLMLPNEICKETMREVITTDEILTMIPRPIADIFFRHLNSNVMF